MKKYLIAFGAVVVVALMLVSIADGQKPLTDVQEVTCYLCRPARRYFVEYSRRFLWTRY